MRRQGHRARQSTHAIGRPSASEQTRWGRRTASAQLHSQCRRSPATFRWTGFSRAAAIDRYATSTFGRAL